MKRFPWKSEKNIEEILNFLKYVGHSFQVRHKVDKIIYIYIYIYNESYIPTTVVQERR